MRNVVEMKYRAEAEHALQTVLAQTDDPLSRHFAQDLLDELALKRQLFAAEIPETDLTDRIPVKRIGNYIIVEKTASHDWPVTDDTFSLKQGDPYINFHIPPAQKEVTLSEWADNYQRVAEYLMMHDIPFKYYLGTTHSRFGAAGRRAGYTSIPLAVGPVVEGAFTEFYNQFLNPSGKPHGGLVLYYQTRGAFLNRFGSFAPLPIR